jgi:hypothetical protein
MKNKKIVIASTLLAIMVLTSSCAPGEYTSHTYGFFSGIIHGMVFVFALIGKLFGTGYGLYAEHNTGFTYWLGFIIGIGGLGGGGAASRRR